MGVDPGSLTERPKDDPQRAAELHEQSRAAYREAARTSHALLVLWQARPHLETIGDLIAASATDEHLRDALADDRRALIALHQIENAMIAAGYRTEEERVVMVMDDGTMRLNVPGTP